MPEKSETITDVKLRNDAAADSADLRVSARPARDPDAWFGELMMHAPAFIAILRGPAHNFEYVNAAYAQLIGHRKIVGMPVIDALPEVGEQGFVELLDRVYRTGQEFVGNEVAVGLQRQPKASLEQRYVNFVYQPIKNGVGDATGIFVHGVDVTDLVLSRKKTEELAAHVALQARTFDTTLASIQDFVYTFDSAGRFTYSNAPLLDLLGITLEDIVGKSFHDLPYPKELADTLQAYITKVFATGEPIRDETQYTNPRGHVGYYEYIFVPVFASDGSVNLVAGSTRDITRFKQFEKQKDEFIGVAAHELRTPVTSIKAYAQILQRRFTRANNPQAAELAAKMNAQVDRLSGLIDDLLDMTKIDAGKLRFNEERFAFGPLVAEIVEEMERTTTRHTMVIVSAPSVEVIGDRDRIGQVLTNLLSNAIKYSPGAGRIIVTTSVGDGEVTLSVQDFGTGIAEFNWTKIFERFYRSTESNGESVPGLGLGLYISAEIARRSGGRIWVDSTPGEGSTFHFTLPTADLCPSAATLSLE